jgi:hypothetical protein
LNKIETNCDTTNTSCDTQKIESNFKVISNYNTNFENAYWKTRKNTGCRDKIPEKYDIKPCETDKNIIYCNCDDKNNKLLQISINTGIILPNVPVKVNVKDAIVMY